MKNYLKLAIIMLGVVGLTSIFSSCKKEKDCTCDDGLVVTTNGDCDALEATYDGKTESLNCK